MDIATVVRQLRGERERAAKEVQGLDAVIALLDGGSFREHTGARKISVAARARIAAAQRARWAKFRAHRRRANGASSTVKRTLSAAARAKIAKAQRARWAKQKKTAQKAAS